MGAVRPAWMMALLLMPAVTGTPAVAATRSVDRWSALIGEAAARFAVPRSWIERVIQAESAGRTLQDGRPIRSGKGAIGLMQLMPGTWAEMRDRLHLGDDPDDPRDNILAGTCYLSMLHARFGYPGLFAAYNAGPARYEEHLSGRPLPRETRDYLARVTGPARDAPSLASRSIFVVPGGGESASKDGPGDDAAIDPLFAIRRR
ncbi:lytic transglycosylase domain-containing protein [Novosphingobium resinovorum]|jgi:soluble lytic murein transglycosylase-like protein|uniref:lytic transglycosylase domain-containing protein n=1 Tax=Novosphingobium TaxID=165696 RepID=UPI001B3C4F99|nr:MULTISPECIES: lytic transglycosylase domain-containing protein [Novosphingobium]MBF7012826.1 lytic transglycosylase domain-containing protein [Novosphingobium sp. HR1a]WJM27564.1 lytic transglycosylase domain-containing protein [Novosphingobium resinovorum]